MAVTQHDLDSFHRFASEQLHNGGTDLSLEDLLYMWQARNLTPEQLNESVLAVRAALRDMENGERGRSLNDFVREFCERNTIAVAE